MNVLKEYKQIGDLQSSSKLHMAVNKLPQVLKAKWWFHFDNKDEDWLDLIMFKKWLSMMAFVHGRVFSFQGRAKRRPMKHK